MSRRRTNKYIEALASGRRPGGFRASTEDAAVVRAAIELKASLSEPPPPDERFVSSLFEQLTDERRARPEERARPEAAPRPRRLPTRAVLVAAAAAALVGVTVVSTEAIEHRSAPSATAAAQDQRLLTGALISAQGRRVGQINLYRGDPSWVFMNIQGSTYNGRVICKLRAERGVTVASGTFDVEEGSGHFARPLRVDVSHVRGAEITTPAGAVVARAVLS